MSKSGLMMGAECANCGCKPCQACDAVCDETPAENFETVYQGTDDGVLESGGSANPVNAFPAPAGPFDGSVSTMAAITLPSDRFPCYARFRVWRNVFEKNGTPSEALSKQSVRINCISGRIRLGLTGLVLNAGESVEFTSTPGTSTATYVFDTSAAVPLVTGADDKSGSPPGYYYYVEAVCTPAEVQFNAEIGWTSADIYHVIYGHMMECYESPPDPPVCEVDCDGTMTTVPNTVYLEISNTTESPTNPPDATYTLPEIAGTYALPLALCPAYLDEFGVTGGTLFASVFLQAIALRSQFPLQYLPLWTPGRGTVVVSISEQDLIDLLCGGAALSGTGTMKCDALGPGGGQIVNLGTISFDWELSL